MFEVDRSEYDRARMLDNVNRMHSKLLQAKVH
jgi:hypothetical protein